MHEGDRRDLCCWRVLRRGAQHPASNFPCVPNSWAHDQKTNPHGGKLPCGFCSQVAHYLLGTDRTPFARTRKVYEMAGERQPYLRDRFADPNYQFPAPGWCWLTQLLRRDDKACRDAMLCHIRQYGIEVKKFPRDYLVNVDEFVTKTPSE